MLFNSFEFILAFLPAVLAGFFVLGGRSAGAATLWLVAASLFFYAWWNPPYVLLILVSTVFNYAAGGLVRRESSRGRGSGLILALAVGGNLALLGYYKYANFFVDTLNQMAGTSWHLERVILPIGISFFTFQQIAYLVDSRRGQTLDHGFVHYCLFVCFFPQLIAGPIVHHREMLEQFRRPSTYRPRVDHFAVGATIFVIGLSKKVLLADHFALDATPVFEAADAGAALHFFQSLRGTLSYTLQLYFDFSGYSDMAIGLARLFGVRLPLNFHSPYKATSVIDFWRRWHVTLSRFLKDYLYIPLGGGRRGRARRYANLLLTMLLGGLWHGAGWTFVFWGGLHGAALAANHAWRSLWGTGADRWWSRWLGRGGTFLFVAFAWIFFRAETFSGALAILQGLTMLPRTLASRLGPAADAARSLGLSFDGPFVRTEDLTSTAVLMLWIGFVWTAPSTQEIMTRFAPAYGYPAPEEGTGCAEPSWLKPIATWAPNRAWAVATGALFALCVLSLTRISEFIYYRF